MSKNNSGWQNEPVRHSLASKGIKTSVEGKSINEDDIQFANERGQDGMHIGEEDQYQHSRYRCPEGGRGMISPENLENLDHFACRVHGEVEPIDTNDLDDLEKFIKEVKEYREMEKEGLEEKGQEYSMPEEEEKFGGKTMGESWVNYFTKKKEVLEELEDEEE